MPHDVGIAWLHIALAGTCLMSCLFAGQLHPALLVEQSGHLVKQHLFEPLPDPRLPGSDSQVSQWLFDFTKLEVPVAAVYYQQMLAIQGPQ